MPLALFLDWKARTERQQHELSIHRGRPNQGLDMRYEVRRGLSCLPTSIKQMPAQFDTQRNHSAACEQFLRCFVSASGASAQSRSCWRAKLASIQRSTQSKWKETTRTPEHANPHVLLQHAATGPARIA